MTAPTALSTLEAPSTLPTGAVHRSRLVLDGHHQGVRRALVDAQAMHRLVLGGFTDAMTPDMTSPREHLGVLHAIDPRTDGTVIAIVQSQARPDWSSTPGVLRVDIHVDPLTYQAGQQVAFQVRVNPTTSHKSGPAGYTQRGRRKPLGRPEEQQAWVIDRLTRHGARVDHVDLGNPVDLTSAAKNLPPERRPRPDAVFALTTIRAQGALTVTDPAAFAQLVRDGLGRGKAYGCGLILTLPLPARA